MAWNKRVDDFLKEIGFKKCVFEQGAYMKNGANKGMVILCLYVHDLLIKGNNEGDISKFKDELMKEFEMTGLGLMT